MLALYHVAGNFGNCTCFFGDFFLEIFQLKIHSDTQYSFKFHQVYIVGKEIEYLTSLWHCVTILSRVHDVCSDIHDIIHKQSGFTVCPSHCNGLILDSQTS